MKRDMDLIRLILIAIEDHPDPMSWVNIDIPDHADLEISYHIMLLSQAGYIDANDLSSADGMCWKAKCLTWEGQEFVAMAKEATLWNKAKETVKSTTGTLTIEGLKIVLSSLIRAALMGS